MRVRDILEGFLVGAILTLGALYLCGCQQREQLPNPSVPRVVSLVREDIQHARVLERHTRQDRRALSDLINTLGKGIK